MTFEEFLEWTDESTRAEWVNGKVELVSPESTSHHRVVLFLVRLLSDYVEARHLGYVMMERVLVRLPAAGSAREPDVFYVSHRRASQIKDVYCDGPPDLIIEVVSRGSVTRDRVRKRDEYEIAGVPEYWIVDPETRTAEFLHLDANGRYMSASTSADGRYHSIAVPDFWLRLTWLWDPPPLADVRRELGLS